MSRAVIRNIIILFAPILLVVAVNEYARLVMKPDTKAKTGYASLTINTQAPNKELCTWQCHNNTNYCKHHHVSWLRPYLAITDKPYFAVINLLKSTGQYQAANIVFLVVLLPIWIYLMLIGSMHLHARNRLLKKKHSI